MLEFSSTSPYLYKIFSSTTTTTIVIIACNANHINCGSYFAFQFLSRNEYLLGMLEQHFGQMNTWNEAMDSLSDKHRNAAGVNSPHRTLGHTTTINSMHTSNVCTL